TAMNHWRGYRDLKSVALARDRRPMDTCDQQPITVARPIAPNARMARRSLRSPSRTNVSVSKAATAVAALVRLVARAKDCVCGSTAFRKGPKEETKSLKLRVAGGSPLRRNGMTAHLSGLMRMTPQVCRAGPEGLAASSVPRLRTHASLR